MFGADRQQRALVFGIWIPRCSADLQVARMQQRLRHNLYDRFIYSFEYIDYVP
jgi:hypothetical protein